jgi:hypothetical protein
LFLVWLIVDENDDASTVVVVASVGERHHDAWSSNLFGQYLDNIVKLLLILLGVVVVASPLESASPYPLFVVVWPHAQDGRDNVSDVGLVCG